MYKKKTTHTARYIRSFVVRTIHNNFVYARDIIIILSNCCFSRSADEAFVCSVLYILLLYYNIYVYIDVWFTSSAVRLLCTYIYIYIYIGNIDQHCFYYLFFYTALFFSPLSPFVYYVQCM